MTGKRRCERFKLGISAVSLVQALLLSLVVACSNVQRSSASPDAVKLLSDPDIHAELSSPETPDGTLVIVSASLGPSLQGQTVTGEYDDIQLPFYKDGDVYRAVLGVPLDHKPGLIPVKIRVGEGSSARETDIGLNIISGNYPISTEPLSVNPRLVQPTNPKDLARIKREVEEIRKVYDTVTRKKYWKGPFAYPVKNVHVFTSSFGKKRVYNGVQTSPHTGLDLRAPTGTPILASAPGKVVLAKRLFFTGNTVILDHGYGVLTLYAHMSKLKVKKGREVKTGAVLGLSGMTGRVNGPHLHWMAIIQRQKVNPLGLTAEVMK